MPIKNCPSGGLRLPLASAARSRADEESGALARTAPRPRGSVGGLLQRLAAAETGMRRHRTAFLHLYRAVLELGNLAERIEHRVGELVRCRLVIAEGYEHG